MPVQRLYALFAGPTQRWQSFDFERPDRDAALRRRGQFIAVNRRTFRAWAIQDDCTGPPELSPPLHLIVHTDAERARQHGARLR